ncbi:MAG: hypothetical protein PVH91_09710 [Pseudomonadales bacterium]|jgi:hypothetical protein
MNTPTHPNPTHQARLIRPWQRFLRLRTAGRPMLAAAWRSPCTAPCAAARSKEGCSG